MEWIMRKERWGKKYEDKRN